MEQILNYFITYSPVIVAIFTQILSFVIIIAKITSYFKHANSEVDNLKASAEYIELRNQVKALIEENKELRYDLSILVDKMANVKNYNNEVKKHDKHN